MIKIKHIQKTHVCIFFILKKINNNKRTKKILIGSVQDKTFSSFFLKVKFLPFHSN